MKGTEQVTDYMQLHGIYIYIRCPRMMLWLKEYGWFGRASYVNISDLDHDLNLFQFI